MTKNIENSLALLYFTYVPTYLFFSVAAGSNLEMDLSSTFLLPPPLFPLGASHAW